MLYDGSAAIEHVEGWWIQLCGSYQFRFIRKIFADVSRPALTQPHEHRPPS